MLGINSTIYFEEVATKRKKTGKCVVCGKHCSRTTKFFQTLSPWNKDKDGNPKTKSQIWGENEEKAKVWMKEPLCHERCEDSLEKGGTNK